jgi:hypothetical protein
MVGSKLTFKEYINTKEQLRSAIDTVPQCSTEYIVKTYCKLPIGESKKQKQHILLKPKHKIIVEWLYNDVDNPTPLNLRFEGPTDVDPFDEQHVLWEGDRLLKWLLRNTHEY